MNHGIPPLDPAAMRHAAARAEDLMRVLADSDRLLLLCQLTQGEQSAGALEGALAIHEPALSRQLAVLRQEGLVATRRDGEQVFYSVASPEALAILRALYATYCGQEHSS